jgi:hypothetical protein
MTHIDFEKMDINLWVLLDDEDMGESKYRKVFARLNINSIQDLMNTDHTTWNDPACHGIIRAVQKNKLRKIIAQLKQ